MLVLAWLVESLLRLIPVQVNSAVGKTAFHGLPLTLKPKRHERT